MITPFGAAPLERNLLPSANEMMPAYHEPVNIFASGMAIPHPDKVKQSGAKGMNQKGFGNAGEDAYFYASGR
jgi:protein phosphatase PTC7